MINIFYEIFKLTQEMAPWLMLGFFFAGVIYVIFPQDKIFQLLGKGNISSVIKSAIIGVPLPLCSCGVIPVTLALRKQGASKGACLSFLISTPTSGIDSIFATYSLLGGVFTIFRVLASFIVGIFAGILENIFAKEKTKPIYNTVSTCVICDNKKPHTHKLYEKIKKIFSYGFIELLEDTGKWILLGLIIGGIITYFIPEGFIEKYLGRGILSMLASLGIAIPLYVCATGSIPIAAALITKGLAPGGAFIFLFAGPATNAVTITVITKYFGKKTTLLYLLSIIIGSILLGLLLNKIWYTQINEAVHICPSCIGFLIKTIFAIILLGLCIFSLRNIFKVKKIDPIVSIKVSDITCAHCAKKIKSAIMKIEGVKSVDVQIKTKIVKVSGKINKEDIIKTIKDIGYTCDE